MNMNAVGIDVSKGKSMVAILRPYGEIVSTPLSKPNHRMTLFICLWTRSGRRVNLTMST